MSYEEIYAEEAHPDTATVDRVFPRKKRLIIDKDSTIQ